MDAVVKTTIFYTNVDDFATINETMRDVCQTPRPHAPHPPISNYRADCWSR